MYGRLILGLDLHEDTGRNNQAIERFDRAGGRLEDVDDALVRPHLKLLPRFLIDVRATQNRVPLNARRHRNRPADPGIGALGMLDDFLRRRIQRPMIVRFHSNSDPIASHICALSVTTKSSTVSYRHNKTSPRQREGRRYRYYLLCQVRKVL